MSKAKEILHAMCHKHNDCFLSGQIGWIVEAMEEYGEICRKEGFDFATHEAIEEIQKNYQPNPK